MKFNLRRLKLADCADISYAFAAQGWDKPISQYEKYVAEQETGERSVFVAFTDTNRSEFAGYVTVVWTSPYKPFAVSNIPEINDLNVLIKYRRNGIGTALLDAAESLVAEGRSVVGIGAGLTPDYGPALTMYVKRGYIPDGLGAIQNDHRIIYGDQIVANDDLTIYFTKGLSL